MSWEKLPPLETFQHCASCPPRPSTADLDTPLAIGFGSVWVSRDEEPVWQGDDASKLLREFEQLAAADPDHDWRFGIDGPMYSCEYQRQGDDEWVLVERGEGFA